MVDWVSDVTGWIILWLRLDFAQFSDMRMMGIVQIVRVAKLSAPGAGLMSK